MTLVVRVAVRLNTSDLGGIFVSLVVPFTGACRDHLKKYVEERDYQEKLFLNIEVPVVSQPTEEPLAKVSKA